MSTHDLDRNTLSDKSEATPVGGVTLRGTHTNLSMSSTLRMLALAAAGIIVAPATAMAQEGNHKPQTEETTSGERGFAFKGFEQKYFLGFTAPPSTVSPRRFIRAFLKRGAMNV